MTERNPAERHPKRDETTAHVDDGELADAGTPLAGEGHDDPQVRDEPTALGEGNDPDTGLPTERDALR